MMFFDFFNSMVRFDLFGEVLIGVFFQYVVSVVLKMLVFMQGGKR